MLGLWLVLFFPVVLLGGVLVLEYFERPVLRTRRAPAAAVPSTCWGWLWSRHHLCWTAPITT